MIHEIFVYQGFCKTLLLLLNPLVLIMRVSRLSFHQVIRVASLLLLFIVVIVVVVVVVNYCCDIIVVVLDNVVIV